MWWLGGNVWGVRLKKRNAGRTPELPLSEAKESRPPRPLPGFDVNRYRLLSPMLYGLCVSAAKSRTSAFIQIITITSAATPLLAERGRAHYVLYPTR